MLVRRTVMATRTHAVSHCTKITARTFFALLTTIQNEGRTRRMVEKWLHAAGRGRRPGCHRPLPALLTRAAHLSGRTNSTQDSTTASSRWGRASATP
jgi:hypothetical protein